MTGMFSEALPWNARQRMYAGSNNSGKSQLILWGNFNRKDMSCMASIKVQHETTLSSNTKGTDPKCVDSFLIAVNGFTQIRDSPPLPYSPGTSTLSGLRKPANLGDKSTFYTNNLASVFIPMTSYDLTDKGNSSNKYLRYLNPSRCLDKVNQYSHCVFTNWLVYLFIWEVRA